MAAAYTRLEKDKQPKLATINDVPIELIEEISDWVAINATGAALPLKPGGPSFANPLWRSSSKSDLVNFASTCRTFRVASYKHLPELSKDITIFSFFELERIRDDTALRSRISPHVRHISLNFTIPLAISVERLNRAMVVLCLHPGLDASVLPHLEGISFASKFLNSYSAHGNVRKDWQAEIRQAGLTGWRATLLGGVAQASAVLAGGQDIMERFGDAEVLFLRGQWSRGHDIVFKSHIPPPFSTESIAHLPLKLLVTPFSPTSPKPPPLLSHPAHHASHLMLTKLLKTAKTAISTPLRKYPATERVQHAWELKEWDEKRENEMIGFGYDIRGTVLFVAGLVDRVVFRVPEPSVMGALD